MLIFLVTLTSNLSAGSYPSLDRAHAFPLVCCRKSVSLSLPSQLVFPEEPVYVHGSSLGMSAIIPQLHDPSETVTLFFLFVLHAACLSAQTLHVCIQFFGFQRMKLSPECSSLGLSVFTCICLGWSHFTQTCFVGSKVSYSYHSSPLVVQQSPVLQESPLLCHLLFVFLLFLV